MDARIALAVLDNTRRQGGQAGIGTIGEFVSWNDYVRNSRHEFRSMEKIQVNLRKDELTALRKAAARTGRSVSELIRDAIRNALFKLSTSGPVAIWDGMPKRTSIEHDGVHDERL